MFSIDSCLKTRPLTFRIARLGMNFTTCSAARSYVGKKEIIVPKNIQFDLEGEQLHITGPHGTLNMRFPNYLNLSKTNDILKVGMDANIEKQATKKQRAMWGTTRAILANNVKGVTMYWQSIIKLVGIGYRTSLNDGNIHLKIGYANDILVSIPTDVQVENPTPTSLVLRGIDRQKVTQFAAKIRSFKKPEPYKGKGIYVDGEKPQLKAKRSIS